MDPSSQPIMISQEQLEHFSAMSHQLEQMQQELQALRQPTPTISSTSLPSLPAKPPKVNTPSEFHGDRLKLDAFLSQLSIYTSLRSSEFRNDSTKILFAASYLRSSAFAWFEPHLRSKDTTSPSPLLDSYATFIEALQQTFGIIDPIPQYERQLATLKQTTSASQYASEFQRIASHLRWNDDALCFTFYKGLKDLVKDELARIEKPATLLELIEKAVRLDNRIFERRKEKSLFALPLPVRAYSPQPRENQRGFNHRPGGNNYLGPQPMELDVLQYQSNRPHKKLTPGERSYRL